MLQHRVTKAVVLFASLSILQTASYAKHKGPKAEDGDLEEFFQIERPLEEREESSATREPSASHATKAETSSSPLGFEASEEGLHCLNHLAKGGTSRKSSLAGKIGTSLLGAGVATACVLTGPTIIGPLIIGIYGGGATAGAATATVRAERKRKRQVELGKLLQASYQVIGLKEVSAKDQAKAVKALISFRDKKMVDSTGTGDQISTEDLAAKLVTMNEAGYFCKAKIFQPRGDFTPGTVGKFARFAGPAGTSKRYARKIARADVTKSDVVAFRQVRIEYEKAVEATKRADMRLIDSLEDR